MILIDDGVAISPAGRHPIATGSEHCASNAQTLVMDYRMIKPLVGDTVSEIHYLWRQMFSRNGVLLYRKQSQMSTWYLPRDSVVPRGLHEGVTRESPRNRARKHVSS